MEGGRGQLNDSLRRLLPSLITFTGLVCAFSAVVLAMHEALTAAGVCILIGYVLDALDGGMARRLGVTSAFGLQLDSLVDVVTFGVAPSALVYQYLRQLAVAPVTVWVVCVGYMVGGVFRLARFNLLPTKESHSDSMGLTISTSGATLALSVLSDRAYDHRLIPAFVFLALVVALTLLMVSRIRYPAMGSVFRRRWLSVTALVVASVLAIWLSPQLVWLGLTGGYVSFGLVRAAYGLIG
jgi:CDP-diacylglycerol--serine O-phosphatidyltransferase